jgi:hypothetical protein
MANNAIACLKQEECITRPHLTWFNNVQRTIQKKHGLQMNMALPSLASSERQLQKAWCYSYCQAREGVHYEAAPTTMRQHQWVAKYCQEVKQLYDGRDLYIDVMRTEQQTMEPGSSVKGGEP